MMQDRTGPDLEALRDLDPGGSEMARPHEHRARRSEGRFTKTETCVCGARRRRRLTSGGEWSGGEPTRTPWERAHLGVVTRAVEENEPLERLRPMAIGSLNRSIRNDPPPEAERRDLAGLDTVHGVAVGAARRLLEWHRKNPDAETIEG